VTRFDMGDCYFDSRRLAADALVGHQAVDSYGETGKIVAVNLDGRGVPQEYFLSLHGEYVWRPADEWSVTPAELEGLA